MRKVEYLGSRQFEKAVIIDCTSVVGRESSWNPMGSHLKFRGTLEESVTIPKSTHDSCEHFAFE